MRRPEVLLVLVVMVPALLMAASKAYEVVPYGNCVSETPRNTPITQTIVMTVDSLTEVWFWVGDTIDTSYFRVDVVDSAVPGHRVAWKSGVHATQCWSWLKFELLPDPVYKPIRGRTYNVEITRPGGSPISFGYDSTSPYDYGYLSVGSDSGLDGQMVGA